MITFDGEINFLHKLSNFSLSVGLHKNDDCQLCAVFLPVLQEMIICARGFGCNLSLGNITYGRRYMHRHQNKELKFVSNFNHDQTLNLKNDTLMIAYGACGYFRGILIKNITQYIQSIARLFMDECEGLIDNQDDLHICIHKDYKKENLKELLKL